uniref:Ribosomal RNA small subunit methyltransferase H n=1 Tax=uncultured bacterium contig00015 TaxID=1181506 RepID=A0A806K2R7_9BACT|nr:rRNA small subunit methyltransferase H [uncultured bacterium contig00015]
MTKNVHTPVLLEETLEFLRPKGKNELMIDCNIGEGGHSYNFLARYRDQGLKIVGIDVDNEIISIAKECLSEFEDRVYFYCGWSFDFFTDYPSEFKRPDIILFDLGVSFYHYKKSGRGFGFGQDEFLDMRLDTSSGITAADLIAKLPERELADLLFNNAGEKYSRRIAALIVNERQKATITTTSALAALVERAVPASYRKGHIHPATRTFQALRIAVNGELSRLPALLEAALRTLEPGGRLGVISFHSLEDKIVKNFFRTMNKDCTCPENAPICKCEGRRSVNILTKKGVVPQKTEIERNPPSRSARLRVVEKVLDEVADD